MQHCSYCGEDFISGESCPSCHEPVTQPYALNLAMSPLPGYPQPAPFDRAPTMKGRIDPGSPHGLTNQGHICEYFGRFEEAIQLYDQAITIDPMYVKAWRRRGALLDKMGRNHEAIESIERAMVIESSL